MAMNISSGRSGGRGRRRGGRRAPMADINVTPFVDVMLVLLIIFMVTAPMLVTGVPVELPESRANALEQPEEPIEIAIDQSGTTYIDGTLVAPSELPARLEEIAGAQDAAKPRQTTGTGTRLAGQDRLTTRVTGYRLQVIRYMVLAFLCCELMTSLAGVTVL